MVLRFNEHRICVGFFVLCVLLHLGFSSVGRHNSLQEIHVFRQLQTATTARYLQAEGFSLAYPTPLFGPPWSVPMEFPLYQLCVAKVANITGLPLEETGRLVAVIFLYLALPAFFGAAGALGLAASRRWLLLGLILLSPAYVFYSRCFMIESTALCVSAWFLYAYCRALERNSTGWLLAASAFGVLASLAKVTTLIVFLVVAAGFTVHVLWRRWRETRQVSTLFGTAVRALIATVPAVALGTAWVRFTDTVKLRNPLSAQLVSANMHDFNFGTWAQRLTGEFWDRIYYHTTMAVAPAVNLALVLVFALFLGRTYRLKALVLLAGFFAGPLILANLYFVHDYYFYASGVFLLGALLLAWSQILDLEMFAPVARWCVILFSAALQVSAYTHVYLYSQRNHDPRPPELATILEAATDEGDVLLIVGQDWDSKIPYYSHRRALMVTDPMVQEPAKVNAVLDRLKPGQVTAMVISGPLRKYPDLFATYVTRLKLNPFPVLASDDTLVYLPYTRLTDTLARLDPTKMRTFSIAEESVIDRVTTVPRRRTFTSGLENRTIFSMMAPEPSLVIHPFGLDAHVEDKQLVFNAHAPTDLIFNIPAHAKSARASFGMDPACYSDKNRTDGVEFRVEWVPASGPHQILHSTFLSPTARPADRGVKTLEIELPAEGDGQIWFRTLAGPTGSIACAWAYWQHIEIK